LFPFTPI